MTSTWQAIGFALLASLTSVANAQEIPVRSGAHDGFARLVMRIPQGREWAISQTDQVARLTFKGHQSGFDTSEIFNLIDRRYISDVTGTSSSLEIEFACDCIANSFVERNEFLVVDVSNRPTGTAVSSQDFVASVDWPMATRQLSFRAVPALDMADRSATRGASTSRKSPEKDSNQDVASAVPDRDVAPTPLTQNTVSDPRDTSIPQPARRAAFEEGLGALLPSADKPNERAVRQLAATQQKLAESVAIAATRGILEPQQRQIDLPLDSVRPQIDTGVFDSSIPEVTSNPKQAETDSLNLRITSSSDLPTRSIANELGSTSMGVRCVAPEQFAVESWGTDTPPAAKIAEFRAKLFTDLDRLDQEVALDLTKLFLHYGFGAEARQVLSIAPSLAENNPGLLEIADIMEHGQAPNGTYLRHFADCDSNIALWGIVAQSPLDPVQPINADAALRAVNALPLHLRRFIAPQLSRRLLEYGDEARAETALRSVDRTPGPTTADADLARADLQIAKGETDAARETLSGIVASNEQQSAEALIKFVDSHLEADTLIDSSVATLIEAYAIEMRGDPIGAELKRSHVLALAKSGQFDEAFDALSRMRYQDGGEAKGELNALLLDIVTRTAPDVAFLERAFAHVNNPQNTLSPSVSAAMADRSANLGFPRLAESILDASEDLPVSSRSRELRARIALDLGRPAEVHAQLFGVQSETADRLRAQANSMQQKHQAAVELYDQLGERNQSAQAALLAEDWARISEQEQNPFAPIANVIKAPMDTSEELDGMLARMSDAISESQNARSVIESLLTDGMAEIEQ